VSAFDPARYWEDRLSRQYTLGGVGYLGLAESYNAWMYRVRREVFVREIRRLPLSPPALSVLDIGSGTGFYVDCWHEVGAGSVTGSDLTEVAVQSLRRAHPGDAFARLDVGGDANPFGDARFDAVSMMDVLYHVVDDARFRRAFETAFGLLAPGGYLIFSENFVHGEAIRIPHQASRSLADIEAAVSGAGFEILRRRPVFQLMNAPVDSDSLLHERWWRLLQRLAARPREGAVLGALLYPLELALVARRSEGPSTEMMICRRPAAT
jgi:SAM-dependent methyltransferase